MFNFYWLQLELLSIENKKPSEILAAAEQAKPGAAPMEHQRLIMNLEGLAGSRLGENERQYVIKNLGQASELAFRKALRR